MKKTPLLNASLSYCIAKLGHTDQLAIADAGLPIPEHCQRIDLALLAGLPSFLQVFEAVTLEMQVERAILAEEIVTHNPPLHRELSAQLHLLEQRQGNTIVVDYISHQAFKLQTADSRAIVRSGECSPYANIILCSGVTF
jgi:D-ribose pyranase